MKTRNKIFRLISLSVLALIAVDILVSVSIAGFGFKPSEEKLINYFSYGASVHRKLETLIGDDQSSASSISMAGWNTVLPERGSALDPTCETKITVIGMSFSNRVADQLADLDACLAIRKIAGPGAPLSHSFYMYEQHGKNDDSSVMVLAILASALPKMNTMAHFNVAFEYPGAHVFPRYYLESQQLKSISPQINSLDEFRNVFHDDDERKALLSLLEQHDAYYDPLIFSYPGLDLSNTIKMLRRSYAQKANRAVESKYYNSTGFTNADNLIEVSKAVIKSFARSSEEAGVIPVIFLINDGDHAGMLDNLFLSMLTENHIAYITSTDFIDSNDLSNYEADGHFTHENDKRLATALHALIVNRTAQLGSIQP